MGNNIGSGANNPNGPLAIGKSDTGQNIRTISHWDYTEGRDYE